MISHVNDIMLRGKVRHVPAHFPWSSHVSCASGHEMLDASVNPVRHVRPTALSCLCQAVLEVGPGAKRCCCRGLTLRHRSPSVANNYAVFLQACPALPVRPHVLSSAARSRPQPSIAFSPVIAGKRDWLICSCVCPGRYRRLTLACPVGLAQGADTQLTDCDIASASGSGVGVEGGAPSLLRCRIHDCERHGLAVFGDALGGSESGAPTARRGLPSTTHLERSLRQAPGP